MKIAFILEDKVASIVEVSSFDDVADVSRRYQASVDVTDAVTQPQVGWEFKDGQIVYPAGVSTKVMSKLKFLERFTDAELAGIEAFAAGTSAYSFAMRVALRKQQVAEFIDISLPQTIAGVGNLVALGLLTSERANLILNTPVTEAERYKGKA